MSDFARMFRELKDLERKNDPIVTRMVQKLDEAVHDSKSKEATEINNSGLQAQIEYLVQSCGQDQVLEILQEVQNGE